MWVIQYIILLSTELSVGYRVHFLDLPNILFFEYIRIIFASNIRIFFDKDLNYFSLYFVKKVCLNTELCFERIYIHRAALVNECI